jgi:hypothetical protein
MQIRSKLFYTYVAFVLLYAVSFLADRPISTFQRLELTTLQYRIISLAVFVPVVLIWFAAFYGYSKLRAYSDLIKGTPDGKHVRIITTGLMILALALPANSLLAAANGIIVDNHPGFLTFGTIIKNYCSVLLPLISFVFISNGTQGLSKLSKKRPTYRTVNLLAGFFIVLSTLYCYLTITSHNLNQIYHMPKVLIVLTIICPYLYTWFLGLSAAYETHLYSRKAPGTLYRRTWNMLASGIAVIIFAQVIVQYVSTATLQFNDFKLIRLLFIVYVLFVLLAAGYIVVAIGAKRLQKIEEV